MASVTFFPAGSQLDSDAIADIQLNVGDRFYATFGEIHYITPRISIGSFRALIFYRPIKIQAIAWFSSNIF